MSERAGIIDAVRTPLALLALVVLVSEVALVSTVHSMSDAWMQLFVVFLVFLLVVGVVAVAALFAWRRPEALYGRSPVEYRRLADGLAEDVEAAFGSVLVDQYDNGGRQAWVTLKQLLEGPRHGDPEEFQSVRNLLAIRLGRKIDNADQRPSRRATAAASESGQMPIG